MRGAMVTESHESLIRRGQNPPDFVVKLFQMIQNEDPSLIGWDDGMLRVAPLPRCIEGLRKSFCHFVVNLCIYSPTSTSAFNPLLTPHRSLTDLIPAHIRANSDEQPTTACCGDFTEILSSLSVFEFPAPAE